VTDYMLKILDLEICADILVGDEMRRGISGGQKKRANTGGQLHDSIIQSVIARNFILNVLSISCWCKVCIYYSL
jgi:hypothetical protein